MPQPYYDKKKKISPFHLAIMEKVYEENAIKRLIYNTAGKRAYAKIVFLSTANKQLSPHMRARLKLKYLPAYDNIYPLELSFPEESLNTDEGVLTLTQEELSKPIVNNTIRNSYNKTAIKEGKSIAEINTFLIAMNLRELTAEEYEKILLNLENKENN